MAAEPTQGMTPKAAQNGAIPREFGDGCKGWICALIAPPPIKSGAQNPHVGSQNGAKPRDFGGKKNMEQCREPLGISEQEKKGGKSDFFPISFKFHYFPPKAADFQQLLPGGINKAGMKPEGRNIS